MPLMLPTDIVRDWDLYPRRAVNAEHVYVIQEALRAGVDLPPLTVEKTSKKLIDGFHRLAAWERIHGDQTGVPVKFKDCKSEQAFLLESIRANASHGRPFSPDDRMHALMLADRLEADPRAVAKALNMTIDRAARLTADALKGPQATEVYGPNTKKPSNLTKAKGHTTQAAYDANMDHQPQAVRLTFYAGQLRVALMNKQVPTRLKKSLRQLYEDLGEFFGDDRRADPVQDPAQKLRDYFTAKGYDRADIDAVIDRMRNRAEFGGEPIVDPLAWCEAGIKTLAEGRAKSEERSGPQMLDGIPHEYVDGVWREVVPA